MIKWEYKREYLEVLSDIDSMFDRLNAAGQDGWEFCYQDNRLLIFKRPIKENSVDEIHKMILAANQEHILKAIKQYGEDKFLRDYHNYLTDNMMGHKNVVVYMISIKNKINQAKENATE